jgi:ribA/ribD-fused uncharacterized protein
MMSKYKFFYGGPFSQWARSPFVIDGVTFNTCEQWMMWNKAQVFGDIDAAYRILATDDPAEQKRIGRQVKNFDDNVWMKLAYPIVVAGNRAKFTQNPAFNEALKKTCGQLLVEASPVDRRWGIGMREGERGIENPANWKGDNLLGKAITEVRHELFGS